MRTISMMAAILCMMLVACEAKKPAPAQTTQAVGRADTKYLKAASMVGYNGSAIEARVSTVLNKAEELNKENKEALK